MPRAEIHADGRLGRDRDRALEQKHFARLISVAVKRDYPISGPPADDREGMLRAIRSRWSRRAASNWTFTAGG